MALAQILTALYLDYSNAPSLSRAPPKGSSPGGGYYVMPLFEGCRSFSSHTEYMWRSSSPLENLRRLATALSSSTLGQKGRLAVPAHIPRVCASCPRCCLYLVSQPVGNHLPSFHLTQRTSEPWLKPLPPNISHCWNSFLVLHSKGFCLHAGYPTLGLSY